MRGLSETGRQNVLSQERFHQPSIHRNQMACGFGTAIARQPADERRHRWPEVRGGGALAVAALRPGRRQQLHVGVTDATGTDVEPERRPR